MSAPKRKCEVCGQTRPDTATVCPVCGGAGQTQTDGNVITGYAPTLILGKNDPRSGHQGLMVSAPGATSETRLSPSGESTINAAGAHGLGKDGEPRVKKTLRQRLQRDGVSVVLEPGADSAGEDGIIRLNGQRFVLQITMALSRTRVDWAAASTGTTTTSADVEDIAGWIEDVIISKVSKSDPPRTILALDANHLGVIANTALVVCYRKQFGSPSRRFGFAGVWLIGPTIEHCFKLE